MKQYVIFCQFGTFYVMEKEEYDKRIWNVRKIQRMEKLENAQEVIDYWVKYLDCTHDQFIIKGEN